MKRLIWFMLYMWSANVLAHKPSDSYLSVNIQKNTVSGRWDIALRDLEFAIGLDGNDDGVITWGELRSKLPEITQYTFSRLQLGTSDNSCSHHVTDMKVDKHTDGKYAVFFFTGACGTAAVEKLNVSYRLFADLDPQHRGLLNLNHDNQSITAVLAPNQPSRIFDIATKAILATTILDFIHEGIWHIWLGFDHILFLFSLLIPSVMVYRGKSWCPVGSLTEAFWDVLKVASAFTLAHSITLSIVVLGYIELPSRWVESIIAASVILAALNNLVPVFTTRRVLFTFTFGLIHGFGFASVLTDLGLPKHSKLISLVGFNLGVEIDQIALVLLFLPITYKLIPYRFYKITVLKSCSVGIASLVSI